MRLKMPDSSSSRLYMGMSRPLKGFMHMVMMVPADQPISLGCGKQHGTLTVARHENAHHGPAERDHVFGGKLVNGHAMCSACRGLRWSPISGPAASQGLRQRLTL